MEDIHNQQLFSEFPPVSTPQWEEKIRSDLKGSYQTGKLDWKTLEGFDVKPYYRDEDLDSLDYLRNLGSLRAEGPSGDTGPHSWVICQEIYPGTSPVNETGERIHEAVRGGVQALRIHLDHALTGNKADLKSLLDYVQPDETILHFTGSMQAEQLYELLCGHAKGKNVVPAALRGSPGADPLGRMMETGIPLTGIENLERLVKTAAKETPLVRVIELNGALIRNAGSTLVEELGVAFSMANEYIVLLSSGETTPSEVAASMQMELATGPQYFMEIAGIRAARILWARICKAWGVDPEAAKMRIHSTSSTWNMTLYDPYNNMLRGTTEAMAAILGGSDMVSVMPFDHPFGINSGFSQRIARNVQIILREEARFHDVADPAAGSYYIENLTHSIAERSWELFREIESLGGFTRAFGKGWIQEKIAASRKVKMERAASGRDCILGTNAFPNFSETILESRRQAYAEEKVRAGLMQPLVPFRISSMFEEVRMETEQRGKRPKVFLLKHGNPAWAAARATFSSNFFACAGYEILDHPVLPDLEAAMQAAKSSGAEIVVMCSADETYPLLASAAVKALGERCLLVVAGYPEHLVEEIKASGITHFIHIRTNFLESLREFNKLLLKLASTDK